MLSGVACGGSKTSSGNEMLKAKLERSLAQVFSPLSSHPPPPPSPPLPARAHTPALAMKIVSVSRAGVSLSRCALSHSRPTTTARILERPASRALRHTPS
eukprot:1464534-Rhodomonas_salina.1